MCVYVVCIMCIYLCVCIYMCVCVHICVYTSMYVYVHVYVSKYACAYVYVFLFCLLTFITNLLPKDSLFSQSSDSLSVPAS